MIPWLAFDFKLQKHHGLRLRTEWKDVPNGGVVLLLPQRRIAWKTQYLLFRSLTMTIHKVDWSWYCILSFFISPPAVVTLQLWLWLWYTVWFYDGSHTFLCSKDGSGVVYFLHPKRRHSKDQFCLKERLLDPEQGTQRYRLRKLFCRWFASNSPIFIRDSMRFSHKPWSRLQKLHGLQSPASSLKLARPPLVLATWCYWPYLGEWDQSWFVHHETLSKLSQTWSGLICLQFVCHALVFWVEELPVHTSIYIHITSPWDVFQLGSSPFCHHDSLQESQHLEPVTFMTNFNLHLF